MYVFMYVHNVMYVCTAHVVHTYMYMYTHDIHVCIINVYFKNDSIHDVMYIDMCTHTTCMYAYVKLHVCVHMYVCSTHVHVVHSTCFDVDMTHPTLIFHPTFVFAF